MGYWAVPSYVGSSGRGTLCRGDNVVSRALSLGGRDIRRELSGFRGLSVVFWLSAPDMCEGLNKSLDINVASLPPVVVITIF